MNIKKPKNLKFLKNLKVYKNKKLKSLDFPNSDIFKFKNKPFHYKI